MLIKPPRLRRPYQQASLEPGHGPPAAPRPGRSLASTPQALACLQSNPGRVQTSGLQSPEQDGPLDTCSPMPPRRWGLSPQSRAQVGPALLTRWHWRGLSRPS